MHQHAVTSTFEQKSIEIDNFNEEEEKEVKERVDKKKNKKKRSGRKKQTAEKKEELKMNKKKMEKGMCDWLKELNKGFKEIKENKKG